VLCGLISEVAHYR